MAGYSQSQLVRGISKALMGYPLLITYLIKKLRPAGEDNSLVDFEYYLETQKPISKFLFDLGRALLLTHTLHQAVEGTKDIMYGIAKKFKPRKQSKIEQYIRTIEENIHA